MEIKSRFDHFNFNVLDLDRSICFYEKALGFGTLSAWEQTERIGRNPKNGVAYMIRARKSVKFKPGKLLLKQLNASSSK